MTRHLNIKKAAVIGAGTMGSGIAAHLANCGIGSLLMDIVPPELSAEDKAQGLTADSSEFRNSIAQNAIKAMPKAKLCPLYDPDSAILITGGNIEDDFDKLSDVDWIIEAAPEKLELKQQLLQRLESIHRKGQIVSSNTSGITLSEMTKGLSPQFLSHVMITHFFNPPRYMHLLELIACEHTDPELFRSFADFSERALGKGAVIAKDTLNFVGNRIGGFDMTIAVRKALELGLTVEEADTILGPLTGRPKSGLYRLLDLIGIDVFVAINAHLYNTLLDDESREIFRPGDLMEKMVEKGLLGDKSGAGFYKKSNDKDGNRVILALDLETFEYHPSRKPEFESISAAKQETDLSVRLKVLLKSEDVVGKFVWEVLSNTLCYAANRIPEISDDIIGVDNAMRWGFNWEKGPFELWDAIGVGYIAERLEQENRQVPQLVRALLDSGGDNFYDFQDDQPVSFDSQSRCLKPIRQRPRVIMLGDMKKANKVVKAGRMASIIDLGDGIICLEFHSKANTLSNEVLNLICTAVEEAQKNFQGLVIGNQGANFCLGADLKEIVGFVEGGDFGALEDFINNLQSAGMALKYCHVPTVAAIHRMVLGGGCEVAMQCDRIQAAPETYIGLVETGVGLIPAGGGCKEWAIRCSDWINGLGGVNMFAKLCKVVEMIGMARSSASAAQARKMGYLRPGDGIVMNRESLIYSAKQTALQLSEQGYHPPLKNNDICVMGRGGIAEFKVRMNMTKQANFISEYDEFVTNKFVHVLCGGDVPSNSQVSEQHLLDLEREAFVSLLGQKKTLERIEYTLKTGNPLRN
jgi:3-hydroxyacyl-CoA dehydrogenase